MYILEQPMTGTFPMKELNVLQILQNLSRVQLRVKCHLLKCKMLKRKEK